MPSNPIVESVQRPPAAPRSAEDDPFAALSDGWLQIDRWINEGGADAGEALREHDPRHRGKRGVE